MADLVSGIVIIVLTLLVLSRILGDSPVFRAVQYLFVGVSLGYAFLVVYFQVLRPGAIQLATGSGDPLLTILRLVPYLLGLLLVARMTGRQAFSWLANLPLALLFGVATALAIGGAMVGTLLPQIIDTARIEAGPLGLVSALVVAGGVILVLSSFSFTRSNTGAATDGRATAVTRAGRWLLMVTFGFFFAGALTTYLAALNERLSFIVAWFSGLVR